MTSYSCRLIQRHFEDQVARTPETIAVFTGSTSFTAVSGSVWGAAKTPEGGGLCLERLTYHQLNQRANQLAHYLRSLGVTAETPIGLCLERSPEMVIGLLGILKAGAAFLPLDPAYPKPRLAFMLADSQAPVLVTRRALEESLDLPVGRRVCLDTDWGLIGQQPTENPIPLAIPDPMAYVIYTSGSTGRPKGVQGLHGATLNRFEWMWRTYPFQPGEVCCHKTALSFVDSIWEILGPLLQGVPAAILSDVEVKDPHHLIAALEANRVTRIVLVPSLLRAMLDSLPPTRPGLPDLRIWVCSGEVLPIDLCRRFQATFPDRILLNLYGCSEAAADATWFDLRDANAEMLASIPIGRPIDGLQAYLLDAHLQPVLAGETGELYLGGAGLARGYLNRPDLTAERFLPDPFSGQPGARLYQTGDLARLREDGQLEFAGRRDQQVKLRGFRIELGEIETTLSDHPGVRQAVVLAREDTPGEKRLVAYVILDKGVSLSDAGLRQYLAQRLPDYMLPAVFIRLEHFPLTPSGKINRLALPRPGAARPALAQPYLAPRTPLEAQLAGIWADLLGLEQVGVLDDFFELGGHSLLAVQLLGRIGQALSVELPVSCLFEAGSVAGMAQFIQASGPLGQPDAEEARPALTILPPVEPANQAPLSFAQQRLWFLDQFIPGTALYSEMAILRFQGELNLLALEHSLGGIIRRHATLRTVYPSEDGRPYQVIQPFQGFSLPCIDLCSLPAPEAELDRRVAEAGGLPFDLAQGPLLRLTLWRLAEQTHVLLLVVHHIIWDDWSLGIFVRELSALYAAETAGSALDLAQLAIQYADYAAWQRQQLGSPAFGAHLAYWKQKLSGAGQGEGQAMLLPTDRPRPSIQTYRGDVYRFAIPASSVDALQVLARQAGTTLFMSLLAIFDILLYRYTGQTDIWVGVPVANRSPVEVEPLIGFFANTLVLRTDLSGNPTFRELLRRVRQTLVEAYSHQDFPFDVLVDVLQPPRDLSRQPLFQVMLALQNERAQTFTLPGVTVHLQEVSGQYAKFDLTLFLAETVDGLAGTLEYNTDLFDRETIARLAGHFQVLLAGLVAQPDRPVTGLPLLTEAERRQMLFEWNRTEVPLPMEACFHQLFAAVASRQPHAPAVVFQGQVMSYGELDARANRLAQALRELGVGDEARVGVCIQRSPDMLVGLLGILKAGATYVPLDPAYPKDRLAYMLADAGVTVLLTQASLLDGLPADTTRVVCLDRDWPHIAAQPAIPPVTQAGPNHLAYMIYTSGSTGRPKGAMLTQRGLLNYLTWCVQAYEIEKGQGAPVHSSISFDLTITGMFAPLLAGRTVFLLPEEPGVEALSEALLHIPDLSLVKLTPAHLEALSQWLGDSARVSVRRFIIGGEALLSQTLAYWMIHAPGARFINEYGPTETVVGCCVFEVAAGDMLPAAVPIGRPIANTRLYVLDRYLQPVPVGVAGELYIGGAGVMRGYHNRPDLTAERLLPDPFGSQPGGRMYCTGDLARYRADGTLEFLGRIDQQVKIRGYRVELEEIESQLRRHPGVLDAAVLVQQTGAAGAHTQRLVAYVVSRPEQSLTAGELTRALSQQLPAYMLPAAYAFATGLPLTPNGKVDRRALAAIQPVVERKDAPPGRRFSDPRHPAEQALADIWIDLLGLEQVGVDDNFFELGGDSILGIQMIARANQAGLQLNLRQLFQYQTIAALAGVAGFTANPAPAAPHPSPLSGTVLLTPIQRWFFERQLPEPQHWNQAFLLETSEEMDLPLLEKTLQHIVNHHDALRLRFVHQPDGWQQAYALPGEPVPFNCVDLTTLPAAAQDRIMTLMAAELQAGLDLAQGPLVRAAYFNLGHPRGSRLLLVAHHLVIDGVSWRIVLEDLQTIYWQLCQNAMLQLSPKTASYQQWAAQLNRYAQSTRLDAEIGYWLDQAARPGAALPVDFPGGENSEASARVLTVWLDAEETRLLLQETLAAYQAQVNDVLLAALVQTLGTWIGAQTLVLDLEGHGREEIGGDLDLSNTVGWFTTIFPLRLALSSGQSPGQLLPVVQEQLRRIPARGIGFGLLRYLRRLPELAHLPQAGIIFNYLGNFDRLFREGMLFNPPLKDPGALRGGCNPRRYLLEIDSQVIDGKLQVDWTYSQNLHRPETIEQLSRGFMQALRQFIGERKPGLPGVGLPGVGDLETAYPLSPMQQGMLYETLLAPDSDVYFEQVCLILAPDVSPEALRQAWQAVLERHAILRTAFVWEGRQQPLQAVRPYMDLPWHQHDRREYPAPETPGNGLPQWLKTWLQADREQPFSLDVPPLMRLNLFPATGVSYLVWSFHHILLDGWSVSLVLQEVFARYQAIRGGYELHLEPVCPYQDFIRWLSQQDRAAAHSFWQRSLHNLQGSTTIGIGPVPAGAPEPMRGEHRQQQVRLSPVLSAALQTVARQYHLTLNTLVQGAWAVLLSRYTGMDEVTFGVTVSGRPSGLAGYERMVGLFINTLPARLAISPHSRLADWLQQVQAQQAEIRQYEYSSLVEVRACSAIPANQPLFESLYVFENYPAGDTLHPVVHQVQYFEKTNYPLVLVVEPGAELGLTVDYDCQRFGGGQWAEASVARLLAHLQTILAGMLSGMDDFVADLPWLAEVEKHPLFDQWSQSSAPLYRVDGPVVRPVDGKTSGFISPRSASEQMVAAVWAETLGLEAVGAEDNFFELGGHSLLVIRVVSRLRELSGVNLPLRSLFDAPTVAQLAQRLDGLQRAAQTSLLPIQPVPRQGALPLSFAQQRLWYLAQLDGQDVAYNIPSALYFQGALDVAALEYSLSETVRRHESLRTVFPQVDGAPVLVIQPPVPVYLPVIDLQALLETQGLTGEALRQVALRLADVQVRQPFDLENGPLMRLSLLRLGADEHILVVTLHHMVSDGWSDNVLRNELAALYAARVAGQPSPLDRLTIQYVDYACWQRQWLQGETLERLVAYWKQRLTGAPPVLGLLTDYPRPAVQNIAGAALHFQVGQALTDRLNRLSREAGTTLFMTLLAAYAVLLSRYARQEDVVIGAPVANRDHPASRPLIGLLINSLALRIDLSGNPSFQELLGRVREVALGAYDHQDLPFEKVIEALQPERTSSYPPLFQVFFSLENSTADVLHLPGLTVKPLEIDNGTVKFDLALYVKETPVGLEGTWQYSPCLFRQDTVQRMLDNWLVLLEALAAHPQQAIGTLNLLSPVERRRLLVDWNATGQLYPGEPILHRYIEAQVERTPEACAVVFEEQCLTYRELNQRANRLAHYLHSQGVGPERPVGLLLERSADVIVALLGVLKAGAAFTPFDLSIPVERLTRILEDAQISFLITQQKLAGPWLLALPGQVMVIDDEREQLSYEPTHNPDVAIDPKNLAYVLFTSGSTGAPKGVAVEHRQICNYMNSILPSYAPAPGDRYGLVSAFAADAGHTQIFLALMTGGCLHVISKERMLDAEALADYFYHRPVEYLKIVPSYLAILLNSARAAHILPQRVLMLGGEAASWDLLERIWSLKPACRVMNHYGPTETTVGVCTYPLQPGQVAPLVGHTSTLPIGRPLGNTRFYILDRNLQLAPQGAPGELFIGGEAVARGYLHLPDRTAERFIPDPFSDQPGGRLYRTGDLVRYLPDGNLEFLGRMDAQVKIRGFRIEPGEVEAVLAEHSNVQAAVVVPWENSLVAYYVPVHSPAPSADELRVFARQNLPVYMVPAACVALERLPLTANGKLNRKALPPPPPIIADGPAFVAPQTETEKILAELWARMLNLPWVGVEDDFFALGGNSLLSIQLITRMSQVGIQVSVSQFLEHPTVAGVARLSHTRLDGDALAYISGQCALLTARSNLLPLRPRGSRPPLFLIHPSGGSAVCYVGLARLLGNDQPVYGIEASGLYEEQALDTDVIVMAERYLHLVRETNTGGPFYLAGWSFGGVVAFEMACQLARQGQPVAFLGMIDTLSPSRALRADDVPVILRFVRWVEGFYQAALDISADDLAGLALDQYLPFVVARMQSLGLDTADLEFIAHSRMILASILHGQAAREYVPQVYPGPLTVFRAYEQEADRASARAHPDFDNPTWGWERYTTQPVTVIPISGGHGVLMDAPYVAGLAEKMRACLDQLQSAIQPGTDQKV